MKRFFCDSCEKEVSSLVNLPVPCHLYSLKNKLTGYVDSEGVAVSDRMDNIELCHKCSNIAYSAAIKALGVA